MVKHPETHQSNTPTFTSSRLGCLRDMSSRKKRQWLEGTNALTMWYYLYRRSKGDPVTHMCYATCEWSKKEHGTCTSQGLRAPCHRCQLYLIALIIVCHEWKKCSSEWDGGESKLSMLRDWREPSTTTGSLSMSLSFVSWRRSQPRRWATGPWMDIKSWALY